MGEGGIMLLLLRACTWRKGNNNFIVSLLLRYTELLPRDLPELESKKKKKKEEEIGTHTEETLSLSKNLMIHIFPLFYCLHGNCGFN